MTDAYRDFGIEVDGLENHMERQEARHEYESLTRDGTDQRRHISDPLGDDDLEGTPDPEGDEDGARPGGEGMGDPYWLRDYYGDWER